MILPDVNVLVYAFRSDSPRHSEVRPWLEDRLRLPEPVALADLVLSGFLRIVTHPRIFAFPSTIEKALAFAEALRSRPNVVLLHPHDRHWGIFTNLCVTAQARGNLIQDAYLAALAIEHDAELVTADRDFARFAGLRWRPPPT